MIIKKHKGRSHKACTGPFTLYPLYLLTKFKRRKNRCKQGRTKTVKIEQSIHGAVGKIDTYMA